MSAESAPKIPRTIVLVGLMGAGKSCIGRELARRLGLPFTDADLEIEEAAGCSIEDIFDLYGEEEFRKGERRVISRLLDQSTRVLATGGGAFMNEATRRDIARRAVSVWLRADLGLLLSRVAKRNNRPLLKGGDRRAVLERLMAERYPVYAEADIIVDTDREPPDATVERVQAAVEAHFAAEAAGKPGRPVTEAAK